MLLDLAEADAVARFGRLDTSTSGDLDVETMDIAVWDKTFAVNLH